MKNYQATVNGQFEFSGLSAADLDIVKNTDGTYHLLHRGKAHHAQVLQADFQKKTITIKINSNRYEVKLEDHYDQLVKKLGLEANAAILVKEIKAPMPGLVLQVLAEAGQEIEVGDSLLILEAMKMENVIKAPGKGIIKAIHVEQGAAVEKGQLLIGLE